MKVPAVLKNKYLFYALAVLAALNVIGYASVKAYECLALFLLAGYGMHCYCNNKSLSILAALFVANFVFGCGRVKEGFEEAMKSPEDLLKEAATSAGRAANQLNNQGNTQGANQAGNVATAAFQASETSCCENGARKGDLTQSQITDCDSGNFCMPSTTTTPTTSTSTTTTSTNDNQNQ